MNARSPQKTNNIKEGASRRNQFEIWAAVLEACARTSRTQSRLLRELGLNTSAIKQALDFLIAGELITRTNNSESDVAYYLTTDRGVEALNAFYRLVKDFFSQK